MIDRFALSLSFLALAACAREPSGEPAQPPSEPQEAPEAPAALEAPVGRGPFLLWIYPRLSARLEGEQAEPLSRPVEIVLADGSDVRLGVRLVEGEVVTLPDDRGRRQAIFLDLHELSPDEEPRLLHRFSLRVTEGPGDDPTDDLLRAETVDGRTISVELSRRGLREFGEELEDEPEVVEAITLTRDEDGSLRAAQRRE